MGRISFVVLLCLSAAPLAADQPAALLKTHCHSCHGRDGSLEGGMNYILDLDRLVSKRLIVPGKPDESPLLKRIEKGEMPPADSPKPSPAEVQALREWIAAGAKTDTSPPRERVSSQSESQWIYDDLRKLDPRARRFARYFRFTPLWNAGASADELATYRNALAKVLNSLSWHPRLSAPEPVGPHGLLFRIDLRWYHWDATLWNRLANEYPYGIQTERTIEKVIPSYTATRLPVVNGDWFIANATRPPLYQDLLQLPVALAELERQLRVDAAVNIQQERVIRVAFNGSGISRNNRVLERHDSVHGYYWRTYDFEEVPQNLGERGLLQPDRRNVFAYPLGPGSLESQFQHAGGEAIFRLPNGMQGYFIMNAVNNRLDKAPTAIVSDPRRLDRAVELGVSCMGCHVTGILPKLDQMHDHLEKNAAAFGKADRELAGALYPAKEKSLAQMEADSKKYLAALAELGVPKTKAEPVIALTQRYEADLTATQAAAELGLSYDDFRQRLSKATNLKRNVGALAVPGGTIARQVWVQGFGDLVEGLGLGTLFQANRDAGRLPDNTGDIDPLESLSGAANAMVFAPDGRTAFLASGDRSLKSVETEAKRDLKRFIGHTASVWSVALSPNGKWLASGSADKTVRIWNVETGQEAKRLFGHEATVTGVAFADNGRVFSSSLDGTLLVWDWKDSPEPVKEWKLPDYAGAMAASPDGKRIAVVTGRRVHVYETKELKHLKAWDAHDSAVSALVFTDVLLTADNDGTVRRWSPAWKKTGEWKTEQNAVTQLAAAGDWFATSGADRKVKAWKQDYNTPMKTFGPIPESVVSIQFAGRQLIAGMRGGAFKIWGLD